MAEPKFRQVMSLEYRIAEQRRWIVEHGGSQAGYIERYGSVHDEDPYGDGGEAIFAADQGALDQLLEQYEALTGRKP